MFTLFFQWLRKNVRAAVHAGLADAMSDVADDGGLEQIAAQLRQRLEALPPPAEASENGHAEPVVAGRRRKGGE